MSDLLPCPFCGKPAKIYGTNLVGCEDTVNCGGEVDWGHNINPAGPIAAWNRRALPAVQPDAAAIREAALREALEGLLTLVEHANFEEGCCCCGDDMLHHQSPMDCGHTPVDMGEYHASLAIKEARAALKGDSQ